MKFVQILLNQIKNLRSIFTIVYIPVLLTLGATGLQAKVNPGNLIRDSATLLKVPFYFGILSNIGVLIWWAAAVICFFCVLMLQNSSRKRGWTIFFGCAGTLTAFLVLDDFLLLHEEAYPQLLGIPEKIVYLIYGVATLAFLVHFRKKIFQTDFVLLGLALVFFALSVAVDASILSLPHILWKNNLGFLVEDSFKLLGIISWTAYFARSGLYALQSQPAPELSSQAIPIDRRFSLKD